MQEYMEQAVIYGGGGVALLFYAFHAWKQGRIGLGNRFLRFGRPGHLERSANPRRFLIMLGIYVLAGSFLLGAGIWAWLQRGAG